MVDIAFLGLAKDCEETLPSFFSLLSSLEASGLTYCAIIGENGSKDRTRDLLRRQSELMPVSVEETDFLSAITDRLKRMAAGREHLKNALGSSGVNARYVCVLDLDNVMGQPPSVDQLKRAVDRMEADDDVFAISATSQPHYYDLFAYEDDRISFESLPAEFSSQKENPLTYYRFLKEAVYPHQRALTSEAERLCISAFNGLAIYRYSEYSEGSYMVQGPMVVCEHVPFNRSIARTSGKRMVLSPILTLKTPADHLVKSFWGFWRRSFMKRFRSFFGGRG